MNKLKQIWSNLRSGFWFMPSVIVVTSIAFAVALIEADSEGNDRWMAQWPRLFGARAEGTRAQNARSRTCFVRGGGYDKLMVDQQEQT